MRILFLSTQFSDATGGSKYDKYFIEQIIQYGYIVDIFTDKNVPPEYAYNRHTFNRFYKTKINEFASYDIIITNSRLYTRLSGIVSLIRNANKDIKIYCFHHHFNYMGESGIKKIIHYILEWSFLKKMDGIILASPYVFSIAHKKVDRGKLHLCELAVEKPKIENNCEMRRTQMVFIGNIEKRKGLLYLVRALARLRKENVEFSMKIIGEKRGQHYESLVRQIKKHELTQDIEFLGRLPKEDNEKVLRQSAVFVFPSLLEGYGIVILEAMNCGLPVVAFDNSAMPYTIRDGINGILVKNRNTKELAAKLKLVLGDDSFYRQIADGAKKSAKSFNTLEKLNEDIKRFCEEL